MDVAPGWNRHSVFLPMHVVSLIDEGLHVRCPDDFSLGLEMLFTMTKQLFSDCRLCVDQSLPLCVWSGWGSQLRSGHSPAAPAAAHAEADAASPSADEACRILLEGNKRCADGTPKHPHEAADWRTHLREGQHPFAVIVGCSDSRVSPELLFDEGLGDLFVIRQAGHVADEDTVASVEYAVGHLHVPLVVVSGHESSARCRRRWTR